MGYSHGFHCNFIGEKIVVHSLALPSYSMEQFNKINSVELAPILLAALLLGSLCTVILEINAVNIEISYINAIVNYTMVIFFLVFI